MYDCEIKIYLAACPDHAAEIIKNMPPLANFSHVFMSGAAPDAEMAFHADLIIAGLGLDNSAFSSLLAAKSAAAEILVLVQRETPLPAAILEHATDIWRMPMGDDELRFHFLRWQKAFRQGKDLWQTSQFLECALDTTPNLVWFKNRNGVHEIVNASFCRTVSKSRQQVQGQRHAYIWNVENDDPACIESERIVMESGKTHVSEEAINTGAGKRVLTTYKSPLRNVDGSMMGTLGIAVDVTQERIYQKKLIQNNLALETIFTTMDCGILCHSLDGSRVVSVNRAALKLLNFASISELENGFQMVASTVMEEDKPKLMATISQLKNVGDSASYEYRVVHADGKVLHVMGNAKLVEKDGEIICQRFLLDCTAQKLAEEKEQSEKKRRQMELVRALSVDYQLVCFIDVDSRNDNILQLMDYPDRNLGKIFASTMPFSQKMEEYIQTCVHPDDRESFRQACSIGALKDELARREIYYFNYRALNGENIHYFQMKAVRAGTRNDPYGIVMGLQSVDARTRHELEQKSRLSDALKQAKKASNAKSVFLSNMSHDIRTPMNAVVGYTSLALTHLDNMGQVKEYLEKILASGNHLISLINDILDMSYIESGKIQLEEKLCELPVLLHELWNIVQPATVARMQNLYLEVDNVRNESIYCDKLRLNQILLNLLSNSVKYTPDGGEISMLVRQQDCSLPDHATYEFRIRDNGIGMSEEFLARIFEPFERARTSTVTGIQGTGLGMAITKNIVEIMKGDIEVRSKLNAGTEFVFRATFRLPPAGCADLEPAVLEKRKALVVEAEPQAGESMARLFRDNNLPVDLSDTAEDALSLLHADAYASYGICIINMDLPEKGGLWLARRIKEEAGENRPFIALLCDNWTEMQKKAAGMDADAILGKPLFWSDLRDCLRQRSEAGDYDGHGILKARHGGRILLAEDNAMNQEIVTELLTEAGHSVDVAANGQEAVDKLKASGQGYYDVILMDVQMPVLDGYRATQIIRALADASLASIPIIAMTANSFEEDKREALMRGMNGHIAKPIDFKILLKTLDEFLA